MISRYAESDNTLAEMWRVNKMNMYQRHARNKAWQEIISMALIIAVSLLFVLTALG